MRQPAATVGRRRSSKGALAKEASKTTVSAGAIATVASSKTIDLVAELKDACAKIRSALAYSGHLRFHHGAETCVVPWDMAALVALIVGEAVTNAIAHAHPTGVEGKIAVECKQDAKGAIVITVTDDGVGLPVDFDTARDGTAGFRVMRALSERLGAKLIFKSTSLGLLVRLHVQNTGFDSKTDSFAAESNGRGNGADAGPGVIGLGRGPAIAPAADRQSSQLLEALPAAVYTTDARGRITFYNAAASALWGCSPELGKSTYCGSWKLYWPDGTPLPHDECPMAMALEQRRPIRGMEAVAERPDGTRVSLIPYPTPLFDAWGGLTGAVNMMVDITERKHAEEALARHRDEQSALYRFTDSLFRAGSPRDVYVAALDAIERALYCERASILLFDEAGVMRFVAWRGLSDGYRQAVERHCPWARDAEDPQPVVIEDVDRADLSDSLEATVKAEGIGALAFIPLLANGGLIGKFMTYYDEPHAFGETEIEVAVTIARQLAFSLQRMRAEDARRRAEEEL